MEREYAHARDAHCDSCRNAFTYDAAEWPAGIEPDHCQVCGSWGPYVVNNWLIEEESAASSIMRKAQLAFIEGRDPVEPYLETDGWNGIKEAAEKGGELQASLLEQYRQNLVAGVAPFTDPRSNPRLKHEA